MEELKPTPSFGCIFVVGSPILRQRPLQSRDSQTIVSARRRSRDSSGDKEADDTIVRVLSPCPTLSQSLSAMEEQTTTAHGGNNLREGGAQTKHARSFTETNDERKVGQNDSTNTDLNSSSHTETRSNGTISSQISTSSSAQNGHGANSKTDGEPSGEGKKEFIPPDGGWGWVVCVTSLWVNGCVMGTVSSFGILYDFVRRQHSEDSQASFKTSFIGSCLLGVMLLMCCVSGILCDVIGLRQTAFTGGLLCIVGFASSAYVTQLEILYVTYGVILGSGFGLLYSPLVAIAGHYFNRRLGLVNGIVTFGPSAFTMGLSFALPSVLKQFGLRNTLLGFAGVGVTIAMATLTWIPLVKDKKAKKPNTEDKQTCNSEEGALSYKRCLRFVVGKVYNRDLWTNKPFVVWCLAMAVGRFGYMEPHFHLVNHVRSLLPDVPASILVTIMAGTSGVSKLVFGLVSDLLRNYRIFLQQGALFAYGVILLFLPLCSNFVGFVVMAVCLGLSDALIMVLFGPNVVDLVGPGRTSQAFGFMSLLSIPGFLSAPAITGRLHDHLHDYDAGFYLAGAVSVIASAILLGVRRPKRELQPRSPESHPKEATGDCEVGSSEQRPSRPVTNDNENPSTYNSHGVILQCTKL